MSQKFDLDIDFVRQLAQLLKDTGLSEIEYAEGDRKIRCATGSTVVYGAPAQSAPVAAPTTSAASPAVEQVSGTPVTSPMVGTAYMASSPESPPFIKEGDKVKQGDTLLIIEAMKVMNPIKAPKAGTVSKILVQNGKPVEFGETLVTID